MANGEGAVEEVTQLTEGRFASHVHSEWSDDASWPLGELREAFRKRGYAGALMCEHDRGFTDDQWGEYREECERHSDDGFILIPGIEYGDEDNVVHLPAWGDLPFLGEGRDPAELLAEVRERGGLAVFAHPWRRGAWARFDPAWAQSLVAVEIWNRKYDGVAPSQRATRLSKEHDIPGFVSLDFHTSRQFFPLATRFDIDGKLSRSSVYEALRAGRWRPEFMGRSALGYTEGAAAITLRSLEGARRVAKRLRSSIHSARGKGTSA